jgi:uncharacterized membrane protein
MFIQHVRGAKIFATEWVASNLINKKQPVINPTQNVMIAMTMIILIIFHHILLVGKVTVLDIRRKRVIGRSAAGRVI